MEFMCNGKAVEYSVLVTTRKRSTEADRNTQTSSSERITNNCMYIIACSISITIEFMSDFVLTFKGFVCNL